MLILDPIADRENKNYEANQQLRLSDCYLSEKHALAICLMASTFVVHCFLVDAPVFMRQHNRCLRNKRTGFETNKNKYAHPESMGKASSSKVIMVEIDVLMVVPKLSNARCRCWTPIWSNLLLIDENILVWSHAHSKAHLQFIYMTDTDLSKSFNLVPVHRSVISLAQQCTTLVIISCLHMPTDTNLLCKQEKMLCIEILFFPHFGTKYNTLFFVFIYR